MAIPNYQTLMLPLLKILGDGQVHHTRDIIQRLADELSLSEEERTKRFSSGKQAVFNNRVGWARTYLKKAGLIESPARGVMNISERGRNTLAQNIQVLDNAYLKQYPEFLEYINYSSSDEVAPAQGIEQGEVSNDTPMDAMEQAHQQLTSGLVAEVLDTVKQVSPEYFETIVVQVMLAMGYGGWSEDSGKTTQYSADGGIDGVINEDPLGLETIYLQAKRYTEGTIGRPTVQSFAGALDMKRAKKGVFITTSKFSREALEFVSLIEKKIVLIDGQRLADLMIKHNLGVTVKDTYQIKTLDTDFFSED